MVNAQIFEKELHWLREVIDLRFKLYFNLNPSIPPVHDAVVKLTPPTFEYSDSTYSQLIEEHSLGFGERVALALCLAVYLRPQILDVFFSQNETFSRHFTEFGGATLNENKGFFPTGETLLFILAGIDITKKLQALTLLQKEHILFKQGIVELIPLNSNAPLQNGLLRLSTEYESQWIYGQPYRPEYNIHFPASRLVSNMEWEKDLILPKGTKRQLEEIKSWIENRNVFLEDWGMGSKFRAGYRSLFYGPPGTGKTFTASLLGKETGREVYRIDLSLIVSKYIGETEKNLAKVFDRAANKKWILFFDEADALFGKRTEVQSSNDRHANQEVSYLLQRLENFSGTTILATNFRGNIDEAFTRRFESIIYFPLPGPEQRLQIWKNALPIDDADKVSQEVDFYAIAEKYELSGAAIMNVVRYASLQAITAKTLIDTKMLLEGIRREYWKEGKSV